MNPFNSGNWVLMSLIAIAMYLSLSHWPFAIILLSSWDRCSFLKLIHTLDCFWLMSMLDCCCCWSLKAVPSFLPWSIKHCFTVSSDCSVRVSCLLATDSATSSCCKKEFLPSLTSYSNKSCESVQRYDEAGWYLWTIVVDSSVSEARIYFLSVFRSLLYHAHKIPTSVIFSAKKYNVEPLYSLPFFVDCL